MDDEKGWCLNHETLQLTGPWTWISKNFEIAGSAITKNGIVMRFSKKHVRKCVKSCRHTYNNQEPTYVSGQFLLIVLVV